MRACGMRDGFQNFRPELRNGRSLVDAIDDVLDIDARHCRRVRPNKIDIRRALRIFA
ncbi:hypothetical protein ACWAT4_03780 [Bradyrhizobium manausense]